MSGVEAGAKVWVRDAALAWVAAQEEGEEGT